MDLYLIDNYDSFTYNLFHCLCEIGARVKVIRNDALTAREVFEMKPQGLVLSPGPCTPNESGICLDIVRMANDAPIPILGVCLGHQVLAQAYGARIVRAPKPVHGKTDSIVHSGTDVFNNLPSPFSATRYHSLIVEKSSLPSVLRVTARNGEGLIMGLRHREKPFFGVQFHPESIASEQGLGLLKNFMDICA